MKKIFKYMFVALMATATMSMAGCSKDDNNNSGNSGNSDLPTYETLERTEWEGSYSTTTSTPQGTMGLTIRWTIDFLANGKAGIMMIFDSQAFENTPMDWTSTYTFDPATGKGTLEDDNLGTVNFTVDAVNRTLKANLVVYVQHEADSDGIPYGGETTLHQTR